MNFADDTIIFLRDFNCHIKIELILKLGKSFYLKNNFSKSQILWAVAYKKRIDKLRKMAWSIQFSIKIVGVHCGNSIHNDRNWENICDNLTKRLHFWNRMQFSLRENKHKSKLHRSKSYYSKMHLKEDWRMNIQFPLEQQNIQPLRYLAQLLIWKVWLGI